MSTPRKSLYPDFDNLDESFKKYLEKMGTKKEEWDSDTQETKADLTRWFHEEMTMTAATSLEIKRESPTAINLEDKDVPDLLTPTLDLPDLPKYRNRIAIFAGAQMGFGDLVFSSRLANYIKQHLPDCEVDVFSTDEDLLKLRSIGIAAKNINEFKDKDYRGVIISPGVISLDTNIIKKLVDMPVTLLSEYDYDRHFNIMLTNLKSNGCKKLSAIKGGLGDDCEGILIEPDLLPENAENHYTSKASDWAKLSDGNLKKELFSSSDAKEYSSNKTLSLAYCSRLPSNHVPIIHANYAANNREIKNYDLVIVATEKKLSDMQGSIQNKLKEILQGGGFTKLVFVDIDNQESNSCDIERNSGLAPKEFRILYTKQIQHIDMLALHKLVGKEFTTITGDQSLGEVISKGAMFHYLVTGAGHKMDLLCSLATLANKLGYTELATCLISDLRDINIIYKKSMEIDFINFCAAVRKNYNLGIRVVNNIKKHFGIKVEPLSETLERESKNVSADVSSLKLHARTGAPPMPATPPSTAAASPPITVPTFVQLQAAAHHHQELVPKQSTPKTVHESKKSLPSFFDTSVTSKQYIFIIPRSFEDGAECKQYMLSHSGNLEDIKRSAEHWARIEGVPFEDSMIVELHIPKREYEDNIIGNKGTYVHKEFIEEFIKCNMLKEDENRDKKKFHP